MEIVRKLVTAQDSKRRRGRADHNSVTVGGVDYPLYRDSSKRWRIRKRTKFIHLELGLGVTDLAAAKAKARHLIETKTTHLHRLHSGGVTLREFCNDYLDLPRDCRDDVARQNITYLNAIVRTVYGREIEDVRLSEVNSMLWAQYMRIKQGGRLIYAPPRKENAGINSACRCALSIFKKDMEREYELRGHRADWNELRRIKYLPPLKVPKTKEKGDLVAAIHGLRETSPEMWRAVGLARFAGMRQNEIQHAQRHWLERDAAGNVSVAIQHRPEEDFYSKVDEPYEALILDPALAEALWAQKDGLLVPTPPSKTLKPRSRTKFFERECNEWVRKYVPTGKGAMHRLRGFYADAIRKQTEDAMRIHLAGVRAAQANLGHSSAETTLQHYLTPKSSRHALR